MFWISKTTWPAGVGTRAILARTVPQERVDRMGRPRKQTVDRRSAQVLVKLTTVEHDRLAAEVVQLRLPSVPALMRERALSGSVSVSEIVELAAADRLALHRLGVNLNQIARVLNAEGLPAIGDVLAQIEVTLAGINAVLLREPIADGA